MRKITSAVVLTSMFTFGLTATTLTASERSEAQVRPAQNQNQHQNELRSQLNDRQL